MTALHEGPDLETEARRTRPQRLTVATWNIGNGTTADARQIMRQGTAALALQEASDQARLIQQLRGDGLGVIRPVAEPGQAATPLVFDPEQLLLLRMIVELMVGRRRLNKGTGPETLKPKWLIGGYFLHRPTRRRLAIASTHRVAGQTPDGSTIRDDVAEQHAREIVQHFRGYGGIPIVLGDWNSWPDDDSLRPFRLADWRTDQALHRRLPTHGKRWAPDAAWWRPDHRIEFLRHRTLDGTRSDHRPLLVDYEITPRIAR
jgi:Endonuclease/Exonuclease/phosphatase family